MEVLMLINRSINSLLMHIGEQNLRQIGASKKNKKRKKTVLLV